MPRSQLRLECEDAERRGVEGQELEGLADGVTKNTQQINPHMLQSMQNQKRTMSQSMSGLFEHNERKSREVSKFDSYRKYTNTKGSNRATGLE